MKYISVPVKKVVQFSWKIFFEGYLQIESEVEKHVDENMLFILFGRLKKKKKSNISSVVNSLDTQTSICISAISFYSMLKKNRIYFNAFLRGFFFRRFLNCLFISSVFHKILSISGSETAKFYKCTSSMSHSRPKTNIYAAQPIKSKYEHT